MNKTQNRYQYCDGYENPRLMQILDKVSIDLKQT